MIKQKMYPFINKVTGNIVHATKSKGKKLGKDWAMPKVTKNDKGEKVFRFEISSWVKGPDGKKHKGTAVVDLTEIEQKKDAENGNADTN